MSRVASLCAFALTLAPAVSAETRQIDAHEHGTGSLNIAIEDNLVVMEFEAPGHDIVGFEYEATSDEDRAKIEQAVAALASPLALFAPSEAARCTVTEARASLLTDQEHHDEDGRDAHDKDEDHHEDEHAHDEGEDHHEDEHAHDEGEDHHEDEHAHDEDQDSSHTAFEAAYRLTCDNPEKLTRLELPYFQSFPNAEKLVVQVATDAGAHAFEADRDAPTVDLRGTH